MVCTDIRAYPYALVFLVYLLNIFLELLLLCVRHALKYIFHIISICRRLQKGGKKCEKSNVQTIQKQYVYMVCICSAGFSDSVIMYDQLISVTCAKFVLFVLAFPTHLFRTNIKQKRMCCWCEKFFSLLAHCVHAPHCSLNLHDFLFLAHQAKHSAVIR